MINRRYFLKSTGAVIGSLFFPVYAFAKKKSKNKHSLKAFIVSDAHFGWKESSQPAKEVQEAAMATIMKRFPDLDVLIDTGDAHHQKSLKSDWGNWLDVIPGSCKDKMFYYTTGNHELKRINNYDSERHVSDLGSLTCRPYYSYDIKGIHFVSLPQLICVSYVPQELTEWLKLDLKVHENKTTIILSHNELRGTTQWFDSVIYRQIANSKKVFDVLDANPQVIAWCHGHNHTYEVVKKGNRLFVSNGRIGGFNPPGHWVKEYGGRSFGRDHLGGIYIEIRSDRFAVKCYSASKNKFFSDMTPQELGPTVGSVDHLSQELLINTSLNISELPAYNYGMGGALDGSRISAIRHHSLHETKGYRELYITACDELAINENYDFTSYSTLKSASFYPRIPAWDIGRIKYDAGSTGGFRGVESKEEPGIRLLKHNKDTWLHASGGGQEKYQYYLCPPSGKYKIIMKARCDKDNLSGIKFEANVYQDNINEQKKVFTICSPEQKISNVTEEISWIFTVPDLKEIDTIYKNPGSPGELLLSFRVFIPAHPASDLFIDYIKLMLADAEEGAGNVKVIENGIAFNHKSNLSSSEVVSFPLPARESHRSVYELYTKGSGKLSWLVKESGVKWQVRNAPVSLQDGKLIIGKLRNNFQTKEEVIIVPCTSISTSYVHRLRHINSATITPMRETGRKQLEVSVNLLSKTKAEIDILIKKRPKKIVGVQNHQLSGNVLTLTVNKPSRINVTF